VDLHAIDIAKTFAIESVEFSRMEFDEESHEIIAIMKVGEPVRNWYPAEAFEKLRDHYYYKLHQIATNDPSFTGVIRLDIILQEAIDQA
jgi:hypothetical protein